VDSALAPAARRGLPVSRRISIGSLSLAIREWPGRGRAFLLVHGLASNARTWDGVAAILNEAGHHVVAVDQRGHGLSDKPDAGYAFDDVTGDLKSLVEALALERPIVAGQSWGGNVVLDFAARWPALLQGLVLVDGGFIDLSARPDATWETISVDLRPPPLAGTPRAGMLERMRSRHPDWPEEAVEMQMGNFETLEDGTIRPWLTLERHMLILRALWDQSPAEIYGRVTTPALIAVADGKNIEYRGRQAAQVTEAQAGLARVIVRWFEDTEHDIHVHRPAALAEWMLAELRDGFFAEAPARA
jgi:pimeloyl-ACP methyl ester carboxylesterase